MRGSNAESAVVAPKYRWFHGMKGEVRPPHQRSVGEDQEISPAAWANPAAFNQRSFLVGEIFRGIDH